MNVPGVRVKLICDSSSSCPRFHELVFFNHQIIKAIVTVRGTSFIKGLLRILGTHSKTTQRVSTRKSEFSRLMGASQCIREIIKSIDAGSATVNARALNCVIATPLKPRHLHIRNLRGCTRNYK